MALRRATSGDVDAVVEDLWVPFYREIARMDDWDALAEDVEAVGRDHVSRSIDRDDVALLLAEADEATGPVGFATVEHRPAPPVFARDAVVQVHELYVVPAYRRRGFATRLVERATEWGDERGCDGTVLSVHPENEAAVGLYEDLGFRETRRHLVRVE
ncbi:MAG: N-acetyltransferase family protein [Halanaeroarchaeum sp.]